VRLAGEVGDGVAKIGSGYSYPEPVAGSYKCSDDLQILVPQS
jgi:hypothetical protein